MTKIQTLAAELSKKTPGLLLKFKNESLLMKIIGVILFFIPGFMTNFTTTIGKNIYFPSKEHLENRDTASALITLSHEYRHVVDSLRYGILYYLGYLFPICLLPLVLISFVFLPWYVSLVLTVLCLSPLPSYPRKLIEVRGYKMSLFAYYTLATKNKSSANGIDKTLKNLINHYNGHFTSANYYYMWPFGVRAELTKAVEDIYSGDILKTDVIYSEVADALNKL